MAGPVKKQSVDPVVDVAESPAPEVKTYESFSVMRAPGGWQFIRTTVAVSDDGTARVIAVETSEPDLKAIILEKFKIAAFRYWTSL